MLLKSVNFISLINIVSICGNEEDSSKRLASSGDPWTPNGPGFETYYVIEYKETGLVLTDAGPHYEMREWNNADSQLWLLEREGHPGQFIIHNLVNGRDIGCPGNDKRYSLLNFNVSRYTSITVEDPSIVLKQQNNKLFCFYNEPDSKSNDWVFTTQTEKIKKFVTNRK